MVGVETERALPLLPEEKPIFGLQWHLTAKCEQNCQHCYLRDESSYASELKNELDLKSCLDVLNDYSRTIERWRACGYISFTGGDPLLKPEIYELIEHARENSITVGILGNPNLLTPEVASRLKELGVARYQVSLDGMEETHDRLRGRKGLFQDALRAIKVLNDVGIRSVVMFTVSRENAGELVDVIHLVSEEKVSAFDFARLVPIGNGAQLKEQMLTPQEYRSLLLRVLKAYENLQESGSQTRFGRKDHLWKLLYYELGLFKRPQLEEQNLIYDGCAIGNRTVSILADGTVYGCRRLPVAIGRVPQQSIRDIFINSEELNKMRMVGKMEKCGNCALLNYCRGCPAVAYGVSGNYFAADPQCWKEVSKK